tara:strand:- start:44 stop:466 length:423 start_codon:yes stop_codon:yes gene_type:complete
MLLINQLSTNNLFNFYEINNTILQQIPSSPIEDNEEFIILLQNLLEESVACIIAQCPSNSFLNSYHKFIDSIKKIREKSYKDAIDKTVKLFNSKNQEQENFLKQSNKKISDFMLECVKRIKDLEQENNTLKLKINEMLLS